MKKKIFLLLAAIFLLLFNDATACSVSITVSPNDTVCGGLSVTFNASVLATCSVFYMDWYLNGVVVLSAATSVPVPYTLNNPQNGDSVSCRVACNPFDICISNTITMTVYPPVVPSVTITAVPDSICYPGCITFIASPVNGGNSPIYQWYADAIPIPAATGIVWTYCNFTAGLHVVYLEMNSSVTCANPIPAISNTVNAVVLICTGIEEKDIGSSLFISPNPNDGIFTVQFNSHSSGSYLTITNLPGEIIHQQKIVSEKAEIDLRREPAGIYFITLRDEKNYSETMKFVKIQK